MNITLAVPSKKDYKKRLQSELANAKNIRDANDRNSILEGLKKILQNYQQGKVYLWNGSELKIIDYPLDDFIYYCGKDFVAPNFKLYKNPYLLITMDANNITIGMLQGKKIVTLYSELESHKVPRKQDAGGQSELRYERNRAIALKCWFNEIAEKINKGSWK